MIAASRVWIQWFWRVLLWLLIDVDIPQLSSSGIQLGESCFHFVYSLQSSSTHSLISSSFDATDLESVIRNILEHPLLPLVHSQSNRDFSVFRIPGSSYSFLGRDDSFQQFYSIFYLCFFPHNTPTQHSNPIATYNKHPTTEQKTNNHKYTWETPR